MEIKTYSLRNEQIIKESVDIFVEHITDGVYLVNKSRYEKENNIITTDQLVDYLNNHRTCVIKKDHKLIVLSEDVNEFHNSVKKDFIPLRTTEKSRGW